MSGINTAVIPVAGFGTRFLPATKATPKEMFPVIDKPLIQYAVEEASDAGVKDFVFVTNPNKGPIETHFQVAEELEKQLIENGKEHYLEPLISLRKKIKISSVMQENPLGLGHAILCARELVGDIDERFSDRILPNQSCCYQ